MKMGALSVKLHHNSQKFTDKSAEKSTLSVNLDEILAELGEQRHFFIRAKLKNALRIQAKTDRLRSVLHLIQVRNGTFSQPPVSMSDGRRDRHVCLPYCVSKMSNVRRFPLKILQAMNRSLFF